MEYVELLPIEVKGHELRIKARDNGKKWCIRYIRKVNDSDNRIKGWRYRTEIQCWGSNLNNTAKKMLQRIEIYKSKTALHNQNAGLVSIELEG